MRVWRLCSKKHAAFDGEGARLAGGRWNLPGTPVVYTSATLSLAVLELLVHVDVAMVPAELVTVLADVPDALRIEQVDIDRLPRGWHRYPAPEALAEIGTRWARELRTPILSVPSAIVPHERNYLLNPLHPDHRRVRVGRVERFMLDPRIV